MLSRRNDGQPDEVQVPCTRNPVAAPVPPYLICIHESREREFPYVGENRKGFTLFTVIVVALHDAEAPVVEAVLFGVPLPLIVMAMLWGTVMPLVHVQEPEGIWIVSPSTAVCVGPLMTAFTSLQLHDAAPYTAAAACGVARKGAVKRRAKTAKRRVNTTRPVILSIDDAPAVLSVTFRNVNSDDVIALMQLRSVVMRAPLDPKFCKAAVVFIRPGSNVRLYHIRGCEGEWQTPCQPSSLRFLLVLGERY
jgi:hypothetical protein